jgi:hypothetical protein
MLPRARATSTAKLRPWFASLFVALFAASLNAQQKPDSTPATSDVSGTYSFLRDGEFVQVTVEDAGKVTGFLSRYGDIESDKGAFLDQFFKQGKLDGDKLTFTTEVLHGTSFAFAGVVGRGEGKKPGDEAYYVIKGKLTETATNDQGKSTARDRDVIFRSFPQASAPHSEPRK